MFSRSDLAILSHIQKQLKENHVPVNWGASCMGRLQSHWYWPPWPSVYSLPCTLSLPSPFLTGAPSLFASVIGSLNVQKKKILCSSGKFPWPLWLGPLDGCQGKGSVGLTGPPVPESYLFLTLWEGVKLWRHNPDLNIWLFLRNELGGIWTDGMIPPKLVKWSVVPGRCAVLEGKASPGTFGRSYF